jgi:hypothetical protein
MSAVIYDLGLDNEYMEGIRAEVAICPDGQSITIDGQGSVDVYPYEKFLGLTVTAPTGMSFYAAIPSDDARRLLQWLTRRYL